MSAPRARDAQPGDVAADAPRPAAQALEPSARRTTFLLAEWLVLFVGFPVVAWLEVIPAGKFLIFAAPVVYALVVWRRNGPAPVDGSRPNLWSLAARIAAVSAALFALAWIGWPERFLILPRAMPLLWALIMALYPLVSALPQEFVFRRYYFWRYRDLFPRRATFLASNIATFSFLHVIYDNWIAVLLTLAGGAIFTLTYASTRRLRYVWLEHAVYGQVIFTSGLGWFFYEPAP